jgi:tRNA/tmRNA/rRNA uracil-C5-methylase (TrmA/RlmC/RlmD family)
VNKTTNWVGQNLTLNIEKVAHGGIFVARHEGRVVFVSHVLPGEKVIAKFMRIAAVLSAEPSQRKSLNPQLTGSSTFGSRPVRAVQEVLSSATST